MSAWLDPRHVANALGGEARGNRVAAPAPGHSKQDRSLSILLKPSARDGFVVYGFAGEDWRELRDYVRERLGLPEWRPDEERPAFEGAVARALRAAAQQPQPQPQLQPERTEAERTSRALTLWHEAIAPIGTVVERYLASRGLHLPAEVIEADAIRFNPGCPFGSLRLPAMVALMRNIVTDEPQAIHRTALMPDGSGKAELPDGSNPKKMLGPAGGAAIKLSIDADVTIGLFISEGIENGLSALCAGFGPVWAAGSSGAVKSFPVLSGIESITIIADADPTGLASARVCAERWHDANREVRTLEPDIGDLNNLLRKLG